MLKIAPQAPQSQGDSCIRQSAFGNRSFGARNMTYSQSHVLVGTTLSISILPFHTPLTQFLDPPPPVHEICGADELWIFLYTLSPPNLCLWALCYFMNPAYSSYKLCSS